MPRTWVWLDSDSSEIRHTSRLNTRYGSLGASAEAVACSRPAKAERNRDEVRSHGHLRSAGLGTNVEPGFSWICMAAIIDVHMLIGLP